MSFSQDYDFSEEAMLEQFLSESHGTDVSDTNGFALGKKWSDVTVKMWKAAIAEQTLCKIELYNDPNLPDWWLDKVMK